MPQNAASFATSERKNGKSEKSKSAQKYINKILDFFDLSFS
jgi:hypothetical protein